MSIYNSSAIAGTMNAGVSNVTGTTAENVTATENYNQVVNNGGQYIKNPRDVLINNVVGQVANGLVISVNSDGTISIEGTATSNTNIRFYDGVIGNIPSAVNETMYQHIPRGKYLFSPSPIGSEVNKYIISCRYGRTINGTSSIIRFPSGTKTLIDNTTGDFDYCLFYFSVWSGQTVNLTVNPYLKKV